jgi:small-conductance mechanosensitive channel
MTLPLQLPWYWWFVRRVQATFDSMAIRYAATAGSIVFFVLFAVAIYRLGPRLKRRYGTDAVEVLQSLFVTVAAVVLSAFLVVIWRTSSEVIDALTFLSISPTEGIKALVTFIVLVGGITVTRLTKRWIATGSGRISITPHQREVAHHAVQIAVFVVVLAFVVTLWDIQVANLFLGAGVLGNVLGFAARKTLSGILSGFVLLFARPFEVGDWVEIGDRDGIVTDITVYNTQIRTFNEEHVLIPNDTVTENEIVNYSKTDRLRLETEVGVDYESDIAAAATVAVGAMERTEAVASQPPPDVIRQEFDDSAVVLRLRYWITTPTVQEKWRAQNAVVESVKAAFEAEGIKIPFPQRELTGREEAGGLRVAEGSADVDGKYEPAVRRRPGADADVSEPVEEALSDETDRAGAEGTDADAERIAEDIDESVTDPPADEDAFL